MGYAAVEELVARHVLETVKRAPAESVVLSAETPAGEGPPVAPALPKLSTVINWGFVVVVGLTVLLGVLVTRTLVGPYTDQFQVDLIWNELNDPEVQNPHGASVGLSSVLAARALIVRDGRTEKFASSIRSPHTKRLAMEGVAEADVLTNNLLAAKELIRNIDDVSAAEDAVAAVYQLLASTGNCSAAGSFLPSALEVARRSIDRGLVFHVAEGLKACNKRQDALELMRKAVTAAKSRSWDADFVVSSLAHLNEEGETTDAIITKRYVDPGAYILVPNSADTPQAAAIVNLTDFKTLRLQVAVPETEATHRKIGEPVRWTTDDYPEQHFDGTVTRAYWALDKPTKTMLTETQMTNPEMKLRPGMPVNARIGLEKKNDALLLPVEAVVKEKASSFVFIVNEGRTKKVLVQAGFNDGTNVEIVSGVNPADLAIVPNKQTLRDGQLVKVTN